MLRRFSPLLSYFLGAICLILLPGLVTLGLAFFQYDGLHPPRFVGLKQFQILLLDPLTWVAFLNTVGYALHAIPLRVLAATGLALFFHRPRPAASLYRAAILIPTVIPEMAYALTWTWILNPRYGPLNAFLRILNLPAPPWLSDSDWAFWGFLLAMLFPLGEGFLILLVGLRHIPAELYEAARIDGATSAVTFFRITLPLLSPWLALFTVRDLVLAIQSSFLPAYLMTRGGPYYALFFAPQLAYEAAFDRLDIGLAAAVMMLLFLLMLGLLSLVYTVFAGGWLDEDDATL